MIQEDYIIEEEKEMKKKIEKIFCPLSKEEKKLILELIGNEQIHMIIKDNTRYDSDKYKKLEELKVKIKDM